MTGEDKMPPNLRMLAILNCLSNKGTPMSLTNFVDEMALPKQTLHRLIQAMVRENFLERQGRFYTPSRKLTAMANGLLEFSPSLQIRKLIMEELARESGETINFVMPGEEGMTYVDRIETNWAFRILLPVGTHVPFHCTASGKTYLSMMRAHQRHKFIQELALTPHTNKTHVSIESLEKELKQIKKRGYAIDDEEFMDGMLAIAVPVVDHQGRFYAVLAIHGPKQRFNEASALAMAERLKACAERVSAATFASP